MCEEHHHHDYEHTAYTHEEEKGATPNDLAKLRILLPHWIEHNEEHVASFERWVVRARELGQEKTAQRIEEAVERMAACGESLVAALKELEK